MNEIRRFEVLDSFRGVFAICVVIFHMHYVGSVTELNFFKGSSLFVEFFFVLSGFVLAHGYAFKERLTFKQFVIPRTFRLFPLHIAMLLVFILLETGKLIAENHGLHFNNDAFSGRNNISEIIPNLFLLQAWTDRTMNLSFNYPSWSISIEYYTYLILFVSLILKGGVRYLLWGIIVIVMAWLTLSEIELLTGAVKKGLYAFFIGVLTYIFYKKIQYHMPKTSLNLSTFIESICVSLIIFIVSSNIENKSIIAGLIFSASIFVFSFERGVLSGFFKCRAFVFIGKLSYSIYMTHAAILFCMVSFFIVLQKITGFNFAPMIEGERYIDLGSIGFNNIFVFVNILFVLLLSNFTYKKIEIKGQKLGKKLIGQ